MSLPKTLTILITGCSPGGTGAALALAFHQAGHRVYATARNPSKLKPLAEQGIETVTLDVISASSIASAVSYITSSLPDGKGLDMLVNNAASSYSMPVADVSLKNAKELFDVNVWSHIAVTQAFLPLLLRSADAFATSRSQSRTMVVNHTSVGSVLAVPFQGIYNASKAALAMLSDTMRLELSPFGIHVIELKTAGVRTNIIANNNVNTKAEQLPEGSIFAPAREVVEKAMSQEELRDIAIPAEQWAAEVSALLLRNKPPYRIWKGHSAQWAWLASCLPSSMLQGTAKKMTKLDVVENIIKQSRK